VNRPQFAGAFLYPLTVHCQIALASRDSFQTHPLRRVSRQTPANAVATPISEGVGVAQLAGMDQHHKHVSCFGTMQRF